MGSKIQYFIFTVLLTISKFVSATEMGAWSYIEGDLDCSLIRNSVCYIGDDSDVDFSLLLSAIERNVCGDIDRGCVDVLIVKVTESEDILAVSSSFYYRVNSGVSPSGVFYFQVLKLDEGGGYKVSKSVKSFVDSVVLTSSHKASGNLASVSDWKNFLDNGAASLRDVKVIEIKD